MGTIETPRILIVDDSAATRAVFRSVLEPLGIDVVTADSAAEALGMSPQEAFAAVVLNVRRGGLEAASSLSHAADGRPVPVLLLSVHDPSPGVIAEALRIGAFDYVVSPVDPALLKLKIQALVEFHQEQERLSDRVSALEEENRRLREVARSA